MGKIARIKPVKLIAGFIYRQDHPLKKAEGMLLKKFGQFDFKSKPIPFDMTDYYREEFGTGLRRVFVSFRKLINPASISRVKNITNNIEAKLSFKSKRSVNIDPGYLDLAKVLLASTKDYSHRVYLDKGVFAEVTLSFKGNSFTPNQ